MYLEQSFCGDNLFLSSHSKFWEFLFSHKILKSDAKFTAWGSKGFSIFPRAQTTWCCLASSHAAKVAKKTIFVLLWLEGTLLCGSWHLLYPGRTLSWHAVVVGWKGSPHGHIFHIWTLVLSFKYFYPWWHCLQPCSKNRIKEQNNSWLLNCNEIDTCKYFP